MASAPDWPAMMRRATAASYCDMKVAEFEGEVATGRFPSPVLLGREERWSRKLLDEALERLTGSAAPDWRRGSNLYA
ncbi:hypothetical protein [uncultured Sphingomonas sp.]|uniref:hypothetical protein n=1 Tax=uncultured Sphingomonas sp. TaxID=158754 RepID=UPI0026046A76|nr:hypothetical protein [uncultured Sphingomonas sp.]